MLELHLDPVGGAAGDMFVAALLDLRPDLEKGLNAELRLCPLITDVRTVLFDHHDGLFRGRRFLAELANEAENVDRAPGEVADQRCDPDLQAPAVDGYGHRNEHDHHTEHGRGPPYADESRGGFHHTHDPRHQHVQWRTIRDALACSKLDPSTIKHAIGIFSLLADAEACVHGVAADDVSFHEVGSWDSITDIVSAAWLIAEVASSRWTVGPIPLGSGRVQSAHGLLPVPSPATVRLLQGFDTIDDGIGGERVTPTGAAIIRYLCNGTAPSRTPRRLEGSGCGFGTKRFPRISNILRVLSFEADEPGIGESDRVAVLECEIDDQTGEDLSHGLDHIRGTPGVLDVVQSPVFGKKGRLTTQVRILADPISVDDVLAAMFDETTTIGIRHSIVTRTKLRRSHTSVELDGRRLPVKKVHRPSGPTLKIEADAVGDLRSHTARMEVRYRAAAKDSMGDA